jgi:hypothetical protein
MPLPAPTTMASKMCWVTGFQVVRSVYPRDTALQAAVIPARVRDIMEYPTSHSIEWRAVMSLLEAVGEITVRRDRKRSEGAA